MSLSIYRRRHMLTLALPTMVENLPHSPRFWCHHVCVPIQSRRVGNLVGSRGLDLESSAFTLNLM